MSVSTANAAGLCVAQPSSPCPLLTYASHNLAPCLSIVDTAISLLGRTVRHVFTVINYPWPLILLGHDFGSTHGLGILQHAQKLFFKDDLTLVFSVYISHGWRFITQKSNHHGNLTIVPGISAGTRS